MFNDTSQLGPWTAASPQIAHNTVKWNEVKFSCRTAGKS